MKLYEDLKYNKEEGTPYYDLFYKNAKYYFKSNETIDEDMFEDEDDENIGIKKRYQPKASFELKGVIKYPDGAKRSIVKDNTRANYNNRIGIKHKTELLKYIKKEVPYGKISLDNSSEKSSPK